MPPRDGEPATDREDAAPRVLVVEDEILVALDLADALARAGHAPVGPVATSAEALRAVEGGPPLAAAVLDVRLAGGDTSEPVAAALAARRVPFLVASGEHPGRLPAPLLRGAAFLPKPYAAADVVRALRAVVVVRR